MIFYILNSLSFKFLFIAILGIYFLPFLSDHIEKNHKIFTTSFASSLLIIGFGESFSVSLNHKELMIINIFFFILSLFISSISINIYKNFKLYLINNFLPIFAIIFILNYKSYYKLLFGTYQSILLIIFLFISILLIRKYFFKNLYIFLILILLGSITSIFFEFGEFLFLNIFIVTIGYLGILKELFISAKTNSTIKNEEIENLKNDFEYEVKKHAKERTFFMEIQKEKIVKKTRIDNLTGVQNKAGLVHEFSKIIGKNKKFSIIMFDIDNFKKINDSYGHIEGDKCLKTLATLTSKTIRSTDILARYGGDEFIIILPQTSIIDSFKIANNLQNKIQKTENPSFTISIGLACYPWDGETMETLIKTADKGLYKSKEKGKNSVSYCGNLSLE